MFQAVVHYLDLITLNLHGPACEWACFMPPDCTKDLVPSCVGRSGPSPGSQRPSLAPLFAQLPLPSHDTRTLRPLRAGARSPRPWATARSGRALAPPVRTWILASRGYSRARGSLVHAEREEKLCTGLPSRLSSRQLERRFLARGPCPVLGNLPKGRTGGADTWLKRHLFPVVAALERGISGTECAQLVCTTYGM